ncbi:MAG: sensor histidine kinase [Salibacteraceae bacterium]
MITPEFPSNEFQRQQEVEKYQLLDTLPQESYDSITALMAHVCDVPISLVTLLDNDRNFLVSHHGIPFNEDPRERSFCGHAILSKEDIMIVPDASKDKRFFDNPLVSEMGVRFYAGAPLVNSKGLKLGTLCIYDMQPKELSEKQVNALVNMAKQVMIVMESHYQNLLLKKSELDLIQRNKDLKKFAALVSHDLKSPISSINGLATLIEDSTENEEDNEVADYIKMIKKSSLSLTKYIDGILEFYHSDELINSKKKNVAVEKIKSELESVYSTELDLKIIYDTELQELHLNQGALMQIMINLVTNGIKYNSKEQREIAISINEDKNNYFFQVKDNGDGIDYHNQGDVFELFETHNRLDRSGQTGMGIGLSTVKKLIEKLDGEIGFESTPKEGTTFHFSIPK